MLKNFSRLSVMSQFCAILLALIAALAVAAVLIGQSLVLSQTLNESRSVADMAEHIATWASRYGGVSVRLKGAVASGAGTYLERRVYTADSSDLGLLSGTRTSTAKMDLNAISNLEAYYSKNPALIQREVSDIASASTSEAKFRITAKTVLNLRNEANPFELQAIASIEKSGAREYSKVLGTRFLYARSLVASESCLKCHGTPSAAPDFIKTNSQFNGGGGFGYEVGKPVGIISVSVPLPPLAKVLASNMTPMLWAAVLVPSSLILLLVFFVARQVVRPLRGLVAHVDTLGRQVRPVKPAANPHAQGGNEVHRLENAVRTLDTALRAGPASQGGLMR